MDRFGRAQLLEGSGWRLTAYRGPDGALVAVPDGVEATARFVDGRVSGSTGCNSYSGSYDLGGDELRIGPLAMTRKACPPPAGCRGAWLHDGARQGRRV